MGQAVLLSNLYGYISAIFGSTESTLLTTVNHINARHQPPRRAAELKQVSRMEATLMRGRLHGLVRRAFLFT